MFGDCSEKERDSLSRHFRDIVGSIIVLFDSLSITALKSLFPKCAGRIDITLDPLKSLLDVSGDPNAPIRLLDPLFRDFLVNQKRCRAGSFWINRMKAHHDVAEGCLHLMSKTLERNICRLKTPGTPRHEIDNAVLNQLLPSQLQYACRYWVRHLQKGYLGIGDVIRVYVFFRTHFLHWLEALSLMGKTSEAILSINLLISISRVRTVRIALSIQDADWKSRSRPTQTYLSFCKMQSDSF